MTGDAGRIGEEPFSSVEPNGLIVDMSVFSSVEFPSDPIPGYEPPDLRPIADSKVIDRAELLPNINDEYRGKAPDVGAYEAGQALPSYGPRAAGIDEETQFLQR
jgi:hypothetical protein